jgi:hypothetical protein
LTESENGERINGLCPPSYVIVADFNATLVDMVSLNSETEQESKRAHTLIFQTQVVHVEGNPHPANTALTSSAFHIVSPVPDAEVQLAEHSLQVPLYPVKLLAKIMRMNHH